MKPTSFPRLFLALLLLACPRSARAEPAAPSESSPALRKHRIGLRPYWSHAFLPGSLSHDAAGLSLDGYVTDWLGLGLDVSLFQPFNGAPDAPSPRAWPLNETQWSGGVHASFVLVRAREGAFVPDVYLLAGTGLVSTRPVPEVDAANRVFSFRPKLALTAGVGARFYFGSSVAVGVEVRDTLYGEQLENQTAAPSVTSGAAGSAQDPATWYGQSRLTSSVEAQLGLTVSFPPPVAPHLPR